MYKFCNNEYSVFQIGNRKVSAELDEAFASLQHHSMTKDSELDLSEFGIIEIFYKQLGWDFKNPPIGKFVCGSWCEFQQRIRFHLEGNSMFREDITGTTWKMPNLPLTTEAIEKKKLKLVSKAA